MADGGQLVFRLKTPIDQRPVIRRHVRIHQQVNTFDPKTGIMVKPFRSFGFSYLGEASDPYISGLAIETVLGLSIQNKQTVSDVDISDWHTYGMKWSWINPNTQRIEFMIDDQSIGSTFPDASVRSCGNPTVGRQLPDWSGLKIGYPNVPGIDATSYDWIRITAIDE